MGALPCTQRDIRAPRPRLTDYFATKRWYTQTYTPEEFDAISSSQLNDYELKNVQTMYEIEQSRNSPYLETAK